MAKPDNRADNAEHLQKSINNTIENLEQTEQYLAEHADEISPQEKQTLQSKNERREKSLNSFREEMKDEASQES
ncbi:small acid-soluble spore protein Tlp [Paenibacillus sp. UNC451MF]|uniref:small acid-soluble spore protein Tlp n=1 Tax=Paenibacillus sp. UNC451MF TaxID=1449063 RepID=UPI00048DC425|nr:small acid-soluble spore protein Tlp [Paenibacillus sp. UNC451MF]